MKIKNVIPLLSIVSAIAAGTAGCAEPAESEVESADDSLTAGTALNAELGGAVGALVVNGEKLCTAALIKAEAGATIQVNGARVSAEGRQIVFGGACVGKISGRQRDFAGVAAFVSQKNGLSLQTPVIGFDFQSRASAGLAVGILAEKSQANPIEVAGVMGGADVGGSVGALFHANDRDGLVVGAGFELHGGFDIAIRTKCTSFVAGASGSVGAGASLQLRGGDDAAAVIRVNGKLQFAAYLDVKIDGQCIRSETLEAINQFGEQMNSYGVGDVVSMQYHGGSGNARMSVYLDKPARYIRINSSGSITGRLGENRCRKLAISGGPCALYLPGGAFFARGWHDIDVDLGFDLFPSARGQLVVFSTSDRALPPPREPE